MQNQHTSQFEAVRTEYFKQLATAIIALITKWSPDELCHFNTLIATNLDKSSKPGDVIRSLEMAELQDIQTATNFAILELSKMNVALATNANSYINAGSEIKYQPKDPKADAFPEVNKIDNQLTIMEGEAAVEDLKIKFDTVSTVETINLQTQELQISTNEVSTSPLVNQPEMEATYSFEEIKALTAQHIKNTLLKEDLAIEIVEKIDSDSNSRNLESSLDAHALDVRNFLKEEILTEDAVSNYISKETGYELADTQLTLIYNEVCTREFLLITLICRFKKDFQPIEFNKNIPEYLGIVEEFKRIAKDANFSEVAIKQAILDLGISELEGNNHSNQYNSIIATLRITNLQAAKVEEIPKSDIYNILFEKLEANFNSDFFTNYSQEIGFDSKEEFLKPLFNSFLIGYLTDINFNVLEEHILTNLFPCDIEVDTGYKDLIFDMYDLSNGTLNSQKTIEILIQKLKSDKINGFTNIFNLLFIGIANGVRKHIKSKSILDPVEALTTTQNVLLGVYEKIVLGYKITEPNQIDLVESRIKRNVSELGLDLVETENQLLSARLAFLEKILLYLGDTSKLKSLYDPKPNKTQEMGKVGKIIEIVKKIRNQINNK